MNPLARAIRAAKRRAAQAWAAGDDAGTARAIRRVRRLKRRRRAASQRLREKMFISAVRVNDRDLAAMLLREIKKRKLETEEERLQQEDA